jgi:hypothetical protein
MEFAAIELLAHSLGRKQPYTATTVREPQVGNLGWVCEIRWILVDAVCCKYRERYKESHG